MTSDATLASALSEMDSAVTTGNYEQALAQASDLLASYPDALRVWRARAQALEAAMKPSLAAEAYSRVLDMLPADRSAMLGLARSLSAAGRVNEARLAAWQALDYAPNDEAIRRIAFGDGDRDRDRDRPLPLSDDQLADESLGQMSAAIAQFRMGLTHRAISSVQRITAQWPDRIDAQVVLAEMLWRSDARISAAELCQSILDAQPDCLNAHALLLALWKNTGNTALEREHIRALDRIDPDHEETLALLGDLSPVSGQDVPAVALVKAQPAPAHEDEVDRSDWVDDLVAAASSAPLPSTPARTELDFGRAEALEDDDTSIAKGDTVDTRTPIPLEWSPVAQGEQDGEDGEGKEDEDRDAPVWLDASTLGASSEDEQTSFKPKQSLDIVPDVKDGVPPALEKLDWVSESKEDRVFDAATEPGSAREVSTPTRIEPSPPAPRGGTARFSRRSDKPEESSLMLARNALEAADLDRAGDLYKRIITSGRDLDQVIADFEAATRAQPTSARLWMLLGEAYTRQGDIPAALDAYARAMRLASGE